MLSARAINQISCKLPQSLMNLLPGLALCLAVTMLAYGLEHIEILLFGKAWLEPLVLAIVLGAIIRSVWHYDIAFKAGVDFSAKYLLEIAVVLLGASISAATLLAVGPVLIFAIAGVVVVSIMLSFSIGKLFKLPTRMALLIACGNSICGNSAIAAVAPVIHAKNDDVASSIAFTAVLGVVVVLLLPQFGMALEMDNIAYGAFAGLTVYAVPQVIAAAAPFGSAAVQMGTLVKLVRVLMLGPVCLVLSFITPFLEEQAAPKKVKLPPLKHMVPWFIIGFLLMMAVRSAGLIPDAFLMPMGKVTTFFTIISMAALGLGVDIRSVAKSGLRVSLTVILSLIGILSISFALLQWLNL